MRYFYFCCRLLIFIAVTAVMEKKFQAHEKIIWTVVLVEPFQA